MSNPDNSNDFLRELLGEDLYAELKEESSPAEKDPPYEPEPSAVPDEKSFPSDQEDSDLKIFDKSSFSSNKNNFNVKYADEDEIGFVTGYYDDDSDTFSDDGEDHVPKRQRKSVPSSIRALLYVVCVVAASIVLAVFVWAAADDVLALTGEDEVVSFTVTDLDSIGTVSRRLKEQGVAIIFISHRLDEVFELTDRVSILRDGEYITTLMTAETNRAELIKYMVGREMTATFPPRNATIGDVALELKNLTGNGVKNISFKAHRGEVLGISGLVGAGRTEIMKVLFGAEPKQWGEVYVNGQLAEIKSPKDAMHVHGICLIPEDRKREGCFLSETISWNLVYNVLGRISKAGVVDTKQEAEIADYYGKAMRIKAPDLKNTKVMTLSGGNQQKVVVGKAMATKSDIIIFDEPTRGVDVGAKYEIYELMNAMCEEGKCVIMVTSGMEELLGMSDRIVVFGEKCLAGELEKDQFSQELILDLASTSDREKENMGA